jgi:hypothetical protein
MSANLSALLREGQRRSPGSYRRRAPADAAVAYLLQARQGLRAMARRQPGNMQAWRLLSQAEEALLDYANARSALERVLAFGGTADRRDLKKLALLREYEAWWGGLGLTPRQLEELGHCLEEALCDSPCDRTLSRTWTWLEFSGLPNPDRIMQTLGERDGYCDCQVLNNVVHA